MYYQAKKNVLELCTYSKLSVSAPILALKNLSISMLFTEHR